MEDFYTGIMPDEHEKQLLRRLVYSSLLDREDWEDVFMDIHCILSYDEYNLIRHKLEELQPTIDQRPSYNQTDISNHLKRFI